MGCTIRLASALLNDIAIMCISADVDYVCVAGDLNADLRRSTHQTDELVKFADDQSWLFCINDLCCEVEYTFCSKGSGIKSLIDDVTLGDNAMSMLDVYIMIDNVQKFRITLP